MYVCASIYIYIYICTYVHICMCVCVCASVSFGGGERRLHSEVEVFFWAHRIGVDGFRAKGLGFSGLGFRVKGLGIRV